MANDRHAADLGASWYAATSVVASARAPLVHDLDVDVCVIGGGLAGLTAAREIARRGWSVAVLEARQVAWNASGRHCGFVVPGFAQSVDRIVERVGLDHAKALWALSEFGVEYVRATIRETGMPGIVPIAGWLDVSKTDDEDALWSLAERLGRDFQASVEYWSADQVRSQLKSEFYFQALHFPRAFHIHALNYALGLAAAAVEAGATIFENTPAIEIDPAGVRKRIVTPSARVRAAHVVLAGNAHIGGLIPELGQSVVPVTTYAAVSAPLGPELTGAIAYRGAISDSNRADCHYRIVDRNRLLWAGRLTPWPSDPRRRAAHFGREIARRYPQLGEVRFEYAWSGVLGLTVHRMPQIGEVSPGLWLASGFGGQGLNTSAMAGNLIARAIVENDDAWRLFLPYGLVWAGGLLGRSAVQVAYWVRRAQEEVGAHLSRRRESAQRKEAQALSAAVSADPAGVAAPGTAPDTGKKVTGGRKTSASVVAEEVAAVATAADLTHNDAESTAERRVGKG